MNHALSTMARRAYMESLLFSKSAFQAGTWPELKAAEFQCFKKPVMKIYRAIAGCDNHDTGVYHPDRTIIRQVQSMHPAVLLHFYRLRCAARLALRTPIIVLAALLASKPARRSWLKSLEADLLWLGKNISIQ